MAFFGRAADRRRGRRRPRARVTAVLGLARGQQYNLTPGLLPVRLHAAYDADRRAGAAGPAGGRAGPLLGLRERAAPGPAVRHRGAAPGRPAGRPGAAGRRPRRGAGLALGTRRPGPAPGLGGPARRRRGPPARPRRPAAGAAVGADRGLGGARPAADAPVACAPSSCSAEESPRAEFFAATPTAAARAAAPATSTSRRCWSSRPRRPPADGGDPGRRRGAARHARLHRVLRRRRRRLRRRGAGVRGVRGRATAWPSVRAEAAMIWLGAGRLDKVAEMIGAFTAATCSPGCPATATGCSPCSACSRARSRSRTASWSTALRRPAGAVRRTLGGQRRRGDVARRHRRHPGPRPTRCSGDADAAARHRAAALATYDRIGASWWRDRLRGRCPATGAAADGRAGRCTCTSSPAACGWSVARGRRSCCRGCAAWCTCTRCSAEPDGTCPATTLVGGEVVEQSGLELLDDEARRAYRARLPSWSWIPTTDRRATRGARLAARPARRRRPGSAVGAAPPGRTPSAPGWRSARRSSPRWRRIAETDPWLGRHLRDRVRTGLECRYESDPDHPVRWLLQAGV